MKLIGAAILEFGQQHSNTVLVYDVLSFEADRGSNTGVISFCPTALYTGFSVELFRDLKHRRLSFDNPTVLFSTMSNR